MESFKRRMRPVLAHFYFLAACVALAACAALVLCVIVSILPCFLFILLKIIMYAMEGSGMQRILHIVCLLCHAIPFMLLSKLMIDYLDTHKYLKSGSSHNDIEMIEGKGEEGISPIRDLKNGIQALADILYGFVFTLIGIVTGLLIGIIVAFDGVMWLYNTKIDIPFIEIAEYLILVGSMMVLLKVYMNIIVNILVLIFLAFFWMLDRFETILSKQEVKG
ncbi:hypothetical protein [[Clostridium] innocuum]|uniref:hypothetical protein n=1 Tax=Clostridium innocuum TaxID=1522 RepID=UPI003A4D8DE4